jgi:hypothetical protein
MSLSNWSKIVATFALLVGVFFVYTAHPAPAMAAKPEAYTVYAPFGCTVGVDCTMVGSGQLVRSNRGVSMNLQTTELDPGAAYTVWWVVFNNPEYCEGPCNGPDLFNPDVNGIVLYAAGHVIGSDGIGNFAGHLAEGDTSGDSPPAEFPGLDDGLVDASKAEIHLVLRTHGQPIPGLVSEQIQTFLGGCGENVCADQQFALPD